MILAGGGAPCPEPDFKNVQTDLLGDDHGPAVVPRMGALGARACPRRWSVDAGGPAREIGAGFVVLGSEAVDRRLQVELRAERPAL